MTSPIDARAAMLLLFDVAPDVIAEHDHWHTHEHMPERLRIPGFLRGSRWIAQGPGPRYCVLYEVAELAVLDSAAYRERLDNPTPWTTAMMAHYVGMRRTLCEIAHVLGRGMGTAGLVVRFAPSAGRERQLLGWLSATATAGIASRPGLASCHLLHYAQVAQMTREQALRGRDESVHSALFVTGYDDSAVAALARNELAKERFVENGAAPDQFASSVVRQHYALTSADAHRPETP
ncbi:MAG TPA: hypothetical protein PLW68_13060 [Casimicrobiaceae bacterium]|nr:hypothetical protein [Casimicrobiaceae bacterium]